jgi:hypothetical protein
MRPVAIAHAGPIRVPRSATVGRLRRKSPYLGIDVGDAIEIAEKIGI